VVEEGGKKGALHQPQAKEEVEREIK